MRSLNLWRNLILLLILSGCSLQSEPEPPRVVRGDMRVSVYSGGKKIVDSERELVHRVELKQSDLSQCDAVFGNPSSWLTLDRDAQGRVIGAKTSSSRGLKFGVVKGDTITAVNTLRITELNGLSGLCAELTTKKRVGMSILRQRENHEVYITVQSS